MYLKKHLYLIWTDSSLSELTYLGEYDYFKSVSFITKLIKYVFITTKTYHNCNAQNINKSKKYFTPTFLTV